jgi:hypothetical protein
MRKDMAKVIVERPRLGGGRSKPGRSRIVLDDDGAPTAAREPARKPQRTKGLNENLAPLRRFLESSAGRPWSKVRSEISEHLRPSSTVQQHVIDHIKDFVAVDTRMVDGEVCMTRRFGGEFTPLSKTSIGLYVHPKTGLLLENKKRVLRKRPPQVDRRRDLGPFRQAHLFGDGAWWDVVLEADPTRVVPTKGPRGAPPAKRKVFTGEPVPDAVHEAGLSAMPLAKLYGRAGVHAVSARRFTRAERKKLGFG